MSQATGSNMLSLTIKEDGLGATEKLIALFEIFCFVLIGKTTKRDCPLECREIITEATVNYRSHVEDIDLINEFGAFAYIELDQPTDRITEVFEIPTYTSDNLLADIGSWLGLLAGMSLLSLVEIAAFICTLLKEKFS